MQANKLVGCASCPTDNAKHLEDIHVYLEHLQHFVTQHMGNPPTEKADELLTMAKNGTIYQIDAVAQTLRYIKEGIITDVVTGQLMRLIILI